MRYSWGHVKVVADRLHYYVAKLQFFMIAWLFFGLPTLEWSWWYLVVLLFLGPLFIWFDYKYVLPQEYGLLWRVNPQAQKIIKMMEERQ